MWRWRWVGLCFSLLAPLMGTAAWAGQQPAKVPRLGVLLFGSPQTEPGMSSFLQDLQKLGYAEGRTIAIEYRSAEGNPERLPDLAADLVRLKPDVIFAVGGDVVLIAKRATGTIPIVATMSNDPVQSGLVTSLGRPGGNVTGVTMVYDELAGKTVELLKEAAPRVSRVAVLWNPNHADPEFRETQRAARILGVRLQSLEVRQAGDFEGAFQAAVRERAEALIVVTSRIMLLHRQRIADFAMKHRLIVVGGWGPWAQLGGLLTYGPNQADMWRRAASHVDKILKGAKPADLPVEQPTRFELVINMKTAKALGLTFPPSILVRADQVIQ
jgi:ABC-type uncharacterized transport system substrate-binding protein